MWRRKMQNIKLNHMESILYMLMKIQIGFIKSRYSCLISITENYILILQLNEKGKL